jgi:dTDP-4-amino-4,6-dideoxygalactose transaminase
VHVWGQASNVEGLQALATTHGLRLMFDAAHAFGCAADSGPIGSFGDLEVFSFHATKFVNSLEGGAIVTDNDDLARQLRFMKNFGFRGYDDVGYVGTNGKMHEISAAMGITSLESMDQFIAINRRNYDRYADGLAGVPGVRLLSFDPQPRLNYQYVVAEVDPALCPLSRDRLYDVLWAEQVLVRRYFYPGVHRMEPYRSRPDALTSSLPGTEAVSARVLVLPTGQAMTLGDVDVVCELIKSAVDHGPDLTARLAGVEDSSRSVARV